MGFCSVACAKLTLLPNDSKYTATITIVFTSYLLLHVTIHLNASSRMRCLAGSDIFPKPPVLPSLGAEQFSGRKRKRTIRREEPDIRDMDVQFGLHGVRQSSVHMKIRIAIHGRERTRSALFTGDRLSSSATVRQRLSIKRLSPRGHRTSLALAVAIPLLHGQHVPSRRVTWGFRIFGGDVDSLLHLRAESVGDHETDVIPASADCAPACRVCRLRVEDQLSVNIPPQS